MRVGSVLLVGLSVLVGCGSQNSSQPVRLAVTVPCVGGGCKEMYSGSGVVGLEQLWQGTARDHTRYAFLLDKWLTGGRGAFTWETDELSPGTCSKPAVGRAYLGDPGYFPYSLATMTRTSWSIVVYDGTKLIGCGSHTGDHPLQTDATPLKDSGTITRQGNRIVITVGTKADDSRITLIPIHNDARRPATRMVLHFLAFGGSSDIVATLRRGTCQKLQPSPDVPLPDLVPNADDTTATATTDVDTPLRVLERQQWVVELGAYFGAERVICAAIAPRHRS